MKTHVPLENEGKGRGFHVRHLQCFMLFGALSVGYGMRVNLSVAIVAMMDRNSTNPNFDEYDWSEQTKSLLLSSFFVGYFIAQVPAGQLAHKFGGRVVLLTGVLISSILALLTPICVELGDWPLLLTVRIVQGLSQGVLFPGTHTILSKWAPVNERGVLCTFAYAGTIFGAVIMFGISGVLATSSFGWPSIFYASGLLGLVWVAAWYRLGANTPYDYKTISIDELQYIENSLGSNARNGEHSERKRKTPWLHIFTSAPVLALLATHCAHNWGFWMLLTQLPSYLKNVLGMDIQSNALLSALPYLTMLILCAVFCTLSNVLTRRQCISLGTSRRLFNTIGQWIPMVALIGLGYMSSDQPVMAVVLLVVTVGINSASFLGFQVNHIDLSPNYAGVLMGITNCAANIMSVLAPLMVGYVVTDVQNVTQWRIVFFIAGAFYLFGNLLFLICGRTKIQSWNDLEETPAQELTPMKTQENKDDKEETHF